MSGFLLHSDQPSLHHLTSVLKMRHGTALPPGKEVDVIFQWGNAQLDNDVDGITVLNPAQGLKNCFSPQTIRQVLQWNGIPTLPLTRKNQGNGNGMQRMATIRRYFVAVFQLDAIGLYRAKGRKLWFHDQSVRNQSDAYEEIQINLKPREIRRVLQNAVRSVYALGLDFAGVLVAVDLSGKIRVIDVQPAPLPSRSLGKKFADAFHKYLHRHALSKNARGDQVVLGADPEFILRNAEGKLVLASRFFQKRGKVGCDDIWLRGDDTRTRLPLVELRPDPSADPRQLAVNLYKTMLLAAKKINHASIQWFAGGMPLRGYPIGGHIHFSKIWLNSHLLRALDNYLALPLLMVEDPKSFHRRPRYGFLGDYRRQFHGGFEYRTPPSWLVSPTVTKGVLALAKVIAASYGELRKTPLSVPEWQHAFYQGQTEQLLPVVKSLWSDLENLSLYARYAKYLQPFKELVFSRRTWNEQQDIRRAWRLPPFHRR
ncbi:hypothetical protein BSNK01_21780 [Bacillaceae bacterium]